MADRVATIKGTFLVPTVSKNRRLYTKENISKAVGRMQHKLATEGTLPLTMFPSHGAADTDNALMTIGRVTSVNQEEDGSATFLADIANTTVGRDMAALVTPSNPYVKGLSIRGAWMGETKTVEADDGKEATTAEDLDIFGIDWTGRPGVEGAQITDAMLAEAYNAHQSGQLISEAADGIAEFFDETTEVVDDTNASVAEKLREAAELLEAGNAPGDGSKPYGDVTYADPGYQKDKKKRYPINTAAHVRAAWSYINQGKNGGEYSSSQLASIKSRIKSAAKKFGINISEELDQLTGDLYELFGAYSGLVDGDDLQKLAHATALKAMVGLNLPDAAEDVDNNDNDMSPTQSTVATSTVVCPKWHSGVPQDAVYCPTCGKPVANAETKDQEIMTEPSNDATDTPTESEAPVADNTVPTEPQAPESAPVVTEAAPAPAGVTLTDEQFKALLAAASAPREAAPAVEAAPVEEAPKTYTEADIEKIRDDARQVAENEALEAARRAGIIPRDGLVGGQTAGQFATPVAPTAAPSQKELSEMSEDEYFANTYEALSSHPGWKRTMDRADTMARGW